MEYFYEKFSYQLAESEDYIELTVIAISAGCIKRPFGELCFPSEVLQKHAKDIKGKPVILDHNDRVDAIVGVVSDSLYDPGLDAIVARLRIIKAGNEKLIGLLKLNPSPITDVSIGAILKTEDRDGKRYVTDINFVELSLVLQGADPKAKRLFSTMCQCYEAFSETEWWDDPELRGKAPRDFFLDPSSRRYPYKTWDGKISCERLKAAMSLSSLHGHRQIYERAKTLYEKHCKGGE
jgi:hypothetical protein